MKNWKITLASIFLCCIIISCGDKKTTDDTEEVDEQQITQEQLEAEKQKAEKEAALQAEAEKRQKEEAEKSAAATKEDEQYSKPKKFMKAENVSFASRGLLSNNIDIKYTIVNTSRSVSYKNVTFRIEFLDANNEVLATKDQKYNEIFAPNRTKDIETIVDKKVKGTEKIRIRCINATAVR